MGRQEEQCASRRPALSIGALEMIAPGRRTLAATLAASMAITVVGLTASIADAAGACAPGETAGVQAGGSAVQIQPATGAPVNANGTTFGLPGLFQARQSSVWSGPTPAPTVTSVSGPSTVTSDATVSGVTATGQTATASTTATAGHAGYAVNTLTSDLGSTYFADPAATRTVLNADGQALADAIIAAGPDLSAAMAGDTGPAATAFQAALTAAAGTAVNAGALVLDGPAATVTGLAASFDVTGTGATASTTIGSLTLGGTLTGAGFAGGAAIDLVGGLGVNGRATVTTPTWSLYGVPVLNPGMRYSETVDVSSLAADAQPGVQAALADVNAAIQQLTTDAGITASVAPGGDGGPGQPGFERSTGLFAAVGSSGMPVVFAGGSAVQTTCSVVVDTRVTPVADAGTVVTGQPVTVTVAANDTATVNGTPIPANQLVYTLTSVPTLGAATMSASGLLTYTAGPAAGVDVLTYRVTYTSGTLPLSND